MLSSITAVEEGPKVPGMAHAVPNREVGIDATVPAFI